MTVECLNCGHTQEIGEDKVYADYLGTFTVCDECDSSYDIDAEGAK